MSSTSEKISIIAIFLAFVAFFIGGALQKEIFESKYDMKLITIMFLVALSILLMIKIISESFDRKNLFKKIEPQLDLILSSVEKSSINWMHTQHEIDTIEKNIKKGMEIWVISPDLKNDTNRDDPQIAEIIKIVEKNMQKGVCYTYIVPDKDPLVRGKIEELLNIFKRYKNTPKLIVKKIDKDYFSLFGNMCFVIYNPTSEGGKPSKVYMELPREEKKWWVELSQVQATIFEGKISEIIEQTK